MRDGQKIINDDKCKTEELENIAMILSGISDNMFSAPSVSVSNKGTYFLSGESIIASENTIKSIDFCCQRGYFADAFTLARKYRDDVIQYIFLTQIIDNMSRISDEEVKEYCGKDLSVGNLLQVIEKSLNILRDGTNKTDIEIAVELWIYGSLEEEKHFTERKKFFDTAKYIGKLTEDTLIKELMEKYLKDIWKKTDRTLNNYVHGNGYHYIVDNYSSYNYRERKMKLIKTLRDITSIFISILSIMAPNMIQSSDYRDDIECGYIPREGCQYWVMPIIVEYMDEFFPEIHPDLLQFLEDNNRCGMKMLSIDYKKK